MSHNQNYTPVIEDLKKLVFRTLEKQTQSMFQQADDFLFDMMSKVANSKEQTDVLDTIRALRLDKMKFVNTFSENFYESLSEKENNALADLKDFRIEDLALTEEGQLEENIAIGNIALKIENAYVWQIQELNKRLETIDKVNDSQYVYMFSPKNIVKPFHKTMSKFDWEIGVKLVIYKLFEKSIVANINNLYSEASALLDSMGIAVSDTPKRGFSGSTFTGGHHPRINRLETEKNTPHDPSVNLNKDLSHPPQQEPLPPGVVPTWAKDLWSSNPAYGQNPQNMQNMDGMNGNFIPPLPFFGNPNIQNPNMGHSNSIVPNNPNFILFAKEINDAMRHFMEGNENELGKRTALVQKYINQQWAENNFGQESLPILQKIQMPLLQTAHMDDSFFTEVDHPIRKLVDEVVKLLEKAYKNKDNTKIEKIIKIIDHVSTNIEEKHSIFVKHNDVQPAKKIEAEEFLNQEKERKEREKEEAEKNAWSVAKKYVGVEIKKILGKRSLPSVLVEPILGGFANIMAKNRKEKGSAQVWKDCQNSIKEIIDLTCGQKELTQETINTVVEQSKTLLALLNDPKEEEKKVAIISVVLTQAFNKKEEERLELEQQERIKQEEKEAEEKKQLELERLRLQELEEARMAKQPIDFASLLHSAQEELKELNELEETEKETLLDDGVVPVDVYEEPPPMPINFEKFDLEEELPNLEATTSEMQVPNQEVDETTTQNSDLTPNPIVENNNPPPELTSEVSVTSLEQTSSLETEETGVKEQPETSVIDNPTTIFEDKIIIQKTETSNFDNTQSNTQSIGSETLNSVDENTHLTLEQKTSNDSDIYLDSLAAFKKIDPSENIETASSNLQKTDTFIDKVDKFEDGQIPLTSDTSLDISHNENEKEHISENAPSTSLPLTVDTELDTTNEDKTLAPQLEVVTAEVTENNQNKNTLDLNVVEFDIPVLVSQTVTLKNENKVPAFQKQVIKSLPTEPLPFELTLKEDPKTEEQKESITIISAVVETSNKSENNPAISQEGVILVEKVLGELSESQSVITEVETEGMDSQATETVIVNKEQNEQKNEFKESQGQNLLSEDRSFSVTPLAPKPVEKLPDISLAQTTVEFVAPTMEEIKNKKEADLAGIVEVKNEPPNEVHEEINLSATQIFNKTTVRQKPDNHEVINLETPKHLIPPKPIQPQQPPSVAQEPIHQHHEDEQEDKKKSVSNFLSFDIGSLFKKDKKNEEKKRVPPPTVSPNPLPARVPPNAVNNPALKKMPETPFNNPVSAPPVAKPAQVPPARPVAVGTPTSNPNSNFPKLAPAFQNVFDVLFDKGKWLWVWDGNALNCLVIEKILGDFIIFTNNTKDQFLKISVFQLMIDLNNGQTEMINWDDKISKAMVELSRLPVKEVQHTPEWSSLDFN